MAPRVLPYMSQLLTCPILNLLQIHISSYLDKTSCFLYDLFSKYQPTDAYLYLQLQTIIKQIAIIYLFV